jgi:hypothetical protein
VNIGTNIGANIGANIEANMGVNNGVSIGWNIGVNIRAKTGVNMRVNTHLLRGEAHMHLMQRLFAVHRVHPVLRLSRLGQSWKRKASHVRMRACPLRSSGPTF